MGKRILIAEHGFLDRMILRDHLVSFGYHIVGEARGGRESVEKFRRLKPDLLLLDATMQDMDGVSIVRELLKEDREISVLICVANGQRAVALEALSAGAKDFITKPIDPRRLRRIIQQIIG